MNKPNTNELIGINVALTIHKHYDFPLLKVINRNFNCDIFSLIYLLYFFYLFHFPVLIF